MRGKAIAWLLALALFLVGFFGRGLVSGGLLALGTIAGNPNYQSNPNADHSPSTFTVLLLGIDNRSLQISVQRTDTIMVVHVNTKSGQVRLMSVPRDTMVEMQGQGIQKINAAAEFEGGPMATVDAVNQLLGTNIQYYVLTNFSGFQSVIDALGCVEIDVPTEMIYNASDVHIHLSPGTQCLNGTEALDFVRWRETKLGDIARTQDQQMLIKAIAHRLLTAGGLARLPLVLPAMGRAVQTNLPGRALVTLMSIARTMGDKSHPQLSETLPGYFLTYQGISYWFVVPQDSLKAYADLVAGRTWPGQPYDQAAVSATQNGTWSSIPLIKVGPATSG